MKTVLQVVNEALTELIRTSVTALVGASDADAKLMLQLLNREGRSLVEKGDEGWTVLQRLATITTVNGQAEYDLPDDYHRHVMNTAWDRTQLTPMNGPILPATWQTIKSGLVLSTSIYRKWRIVRSGFGRTISIDPVPTADGDELVYEYISNGWCCDSTATTPQEDVAADNDLLVLDRDLVVMGLKWRWRKEHGHDIISDLAEYNERCDVKLAQDKQTSPLSLVGPTYSSDDDPPMLGWRNIPDTGYGP